MRTQTSSRLQPAGVMPGSRGLSFSALLTMVVVGIGLCALIAAPFLSALTWAFALAVVAEPFHERLERRVRYPNVAAALSVIAVALLILVPVAVVGWQVGLQASAWSGRIQEYVNDEAVREAFARIPGGARAYDAVMSGRDGASGLMPNGAQASAWILSAGAAIFQSAVALFALFFLLRDRAAVIATVRSYMPMTRVEADYFLERIRSMTHATLYGNVVTAAVQGILGGLMFAFVEIPGALLWGMAMALLSLIPSSGAFLIWIPAGVMLAAQGEWGRAAIVAVWGALAVSSIDNVLYPWLVGQEVRLHTLVVFLAVVGGLIIFGAAGLVLGPVTAAATIAMLDILRRRSRRNGASSRSRPAA